MPKFGNKNALHGYFWGQNFKKLLSYLKSAPSVLSKYELLANTVKFGIESAFCRGPRSAFSQRLGPNPGSLYKVCLLKELFSIIS